MSGIKKTVAAILLLIGLAEILGSLQVVWRLRQPLPLHGGSASIPGLDAPVEILRDQWGVSHIYARDGYDLFFAQGYTQAQDRWWQMEFCRLASQGRLAELMGEPALAADLQVRALGLKQVSALEWQRYNSATASYLKAFADGVNAYLSGKEPGDVAFEYSVLRFKGLDHNIEPWSPIDTLTFTRYLLFQLSANAELEETYAKLQNTVGPSMAAELIPVDANTSPSTILQEVDYATEEDSSGFQSQPPSQVHDVRGSILSPQWDGPGHNSGLGGNSWAVSGRLSQSGQPLLAYDSHLANSLPSPWYEIGLHCQPLSPDCPFAASGFTFSLLPGVFVGHNPTVAWDFTASGADVQDYYEVRVREGDPLSYEWDGAWRNMITSTERFSIAGAEPLTVMMRHTHLGPIVNDYDVDPATHSVATGDTPLALRWIGLQPSPFFQAIFAINQAGNWHEFRQALSLWRVGPLNVIYADIYGNVGYQMTGEIPIRSASHSGVGPAPGWTDAYSWQGTIPWHLLPNVFDPGRGYVVNATQNGAPLSYWTFLRSRLDTSGNVQFQSVALEGGYRASRITELLKSTRPHSIATFQAMQLDDELPTARELLPILAGLSLGTEELADTRNWLVAWDGRTESDSAQAALYALLWKELLEELYADNLKDMSIVDGLPTWCTVR